MMRYVDRFLDRITMYRLVLYYLAALLAAALVMALTGLIPHSFAALAFSSALILATCEAANAVFAWVFDVPANAESASITALILILILDPVAPADLAGATALFCAAVWAIASKFILAHGGKHVFNPAALGAVLAGLLLDRPATWWVGGNLPLLPLVLIGGLLLVRKLRRLDLVVSFILVNLTTIAATTASPDYVTALTETLLSSPLFFFAFVMLTEPLTAPTMRRARLAFAALIGVLSAPNVHVGTFYFTPELALLAGNLLAYAISPKGRLRLSLERNERVSSDCYDFMFSSSRRLTFRAGQYVEWTLGFPNPDSRGNRRYFTIASAPGEPEIRLGVKFYPEASAFKRALAGLEPGDTIFASQLAGDFTLPRDHNAKLAFLAGGIGITPFRSMLQDLLDRQEARPIVVLYGTERADDIAYRDVLRDAASHLNIRTVCAVAQNPGAGHYPGYIDEHLVRKAVPDFRERTFYVSGPQAMVKAVRHMLRRMGVHRSRIKVDFFPGFA